jgi:DNA-binding NarL/FixJ family response regulator
MTKLLLVDDHPLVLEGMKALLTDSQQIEYIKVATNAYEAIETLKNHEIDLAFLDINLPDISGIDLCLKIKAEFPKVKCIALSTFTERSYISRMIQNGAVGYLMKSSSKEEIMEAISQVTAGGMYMNVNFTESHSLPEKNMPFLTLREKEVLQLIANGLTNQQIADKLFLSVLTIDSHRKNLLAKFEVGNTASLIKVAAQNDML